ncbi:MAG: S8 family serine peptidase [Pyrinomonadaceae bacterium]
MTKKTTNKKSKAPSAPTKNSKSKNSSNDNSALPSKIFAQVSPRSIGGVSMFEAQNQIQSGTVANFFSEAEAVNEAVARLQEAGFEILQISPLTINIAGKPETYKKAFNTEIVVEDRGVIKGLASSDNDNIAHFLETPDNDVPGLIETGGTVFENSIEGVALEEPRYFMAPSMFPPLKSYWHLDVPAGVSLGCNADKAHRTGITGKGVKVAMVDSGHYKHPFFVGRGYNVAPVVLGPATANPLKDESGHGTGESANIFAVAPDVQLLPVKINFVNSIGAFNAAVGLNPDIITCSWGSDKRNGPLSAADMALATAIAAAVASGITVVFSAGNGHWGFPGQHPDVISAGGVFMDQNESLRASNYASGFISNIYPSRRVPDLCGLVGMLPKAIYIMLPLEPNDQIDVGNAGGTFPNGDETANNDGWAAFSGTSAAAPQLAGAAALIKQACPKLKPAQIKDILRKTARDVTTGSSNPNTTGTAGVGPDTATGDGLVDAHKAVMLAKVRCLGPIIIGPPITIHPPIQPPITIQPPIHPPITVGPPIGPLPPQPIRPPIQPQPIQPPRPIAPIVNPGPIIGLSESSESGEMTQTPDQTETAEQKTSQLSETDVSALEDLIINSDFEIE